MRTLENKIKNHAFNKKIKIKIKMKMERFIIIYELKIKEVRERYSLIGEENNKNREFVC